MKLLSGFGRFVKSVIGWLLLIVFGGTGVYALLDRTRDEPAVVVVCLLAPCVIYTIHRLKSSRLSGKNRAMHRCLP